MTEIDALVYTWVGKILQCSAKIALYLRIQYKIATQSL